MTLSFAGAVPFVGGPTLSGAVPLSDTRETRLRFRGRPPALAVKHPQAGTRAMKSPMWAFAHVGFLSAAVLGFPCRQPLIGCDGDVPGFGCRRSRMEHRDN